MSDPLHDVCDVTATHEGAEWRCSKIRGHFMRQQSLAGPGPEGGLGHFAVADDGSGSLRWWARTGFPGVEMVLYLPKDGHEDRRFLKATGMRMAERSKA